MITFLLEPLEQTPYCILKSGKLFKLEMVEGTFLYEES